ncbi:trimethylamine monooxygenase-like [Mytilus edulis]|uniref:trimethylamine monooxygenase-like n=1 Tax=Mytilus edulis TaxID=6550 RepID=UPI0039EF3C0F
MDVIPPNQSRLVKKSKSDLKQFIKWTTVVRYVRYNTKSDDFTVTTEDIKTGHIYDTNFTHVIVAVGIYNSPDKPYFEGIETFPGRIIHSNDFRDATQFKGQHMLVVGAKNSAEDIALQCMKFGAKSIVTSYRSTPLNYNWPVGIEERPLVQKIEGTVVHFLDSSFTEVDSIILSTGYKYMFPFMENNLQPSLSNILYPAGLYKGSLWLQGGNRKLFYIGVPHHCFTFTMFDAQGLWICRYITDTLPNKAKSCEEMKKEDQKWLQRCNSLKDIHEQIDSQSDFIKDLSDGTEYSPDAPKKNDFFHKWASDKKANIVTYRDQQYKSLYSGTETVPLFQNCDDSLNSFVKR